MSRAARRIALSAGSLVLAFLGAELVLRLAGYDPLGAALSGRIELVRPSDFPGRGYELVPGAQGVGWGTGPENSIRTTFCSPWTRTTCSQGCPSGPVSSSVQSNVVQA